MYISEDRMDMTLQLDKQVIRNTKRLLKAARKEFKQVRPAMVVVGATMPRVATWFNEFAEDYNQHSKVGNRVRLMMTEEGNIGIDQSVTYDYEIYQR